jgi:two-component system sensor histidine kinase PhoQ
LRYRNTLADLAHSLKTPISVLIGLYEQGELSHEDMETFKSQTLVMWQLVDYQLQKAAVKGHQTMSSPIALEPIVQQIIESLDKVYKQKLLKVTAEFDEGVTFNIEKGDLFELFGNLLDNAYQWAATQIMVSVRVIEASDNYPAGIQIVIEDDGPGISADNLKLALQRGVKVDESKTGNGIGLAIVSEMLTSYKGTLKPEQGEFGGQRWVVFIPR